TATIDWCEENYAWSYFIAEFWNTASISYLSVSMSSIFSSVYLITDPLKYHRCPSLH
ncbi:unnamed protein product, partial [Ectocarpus sp. 12 AP-2014]